MTNAAQSGGARDAAPRPLLDDLASGASIDEIASKRNYTRGRAESLLRMELKAISIRPARDYAKLQIRRLEAIIGRLTEKANSGDLAAVDRTLKILDRLDRYHGYGRPSAKGGTADQKIVDEKDDEAFDRKLADLVARSKRAKENNKHDGKTA